jgi:hypothetical protein
MITWAAVFKVECPLFRWGRGRRQSNTVTVIAIEEPRRRIRVAEGATRIRPRQ